MTNLERQRRRLTQNGAAAVLHKPELPELPDGERPPIADDVAFFADWQTIRIDIEAADRLLALIADGGDPSRLLTGIVGMLEGLRQETARAVTRLAARPAVGPAGAEIAALAERVAYLENQTTAIMRQLSELTDMWRRWAGV
jgi:hypothetical protein